VGTLAETGQNVPNSISDDATPHCLLGKLITLSLTGGHQSPHHMPQKQEDQKGQHFLKKVTPARAANCSRTNKVRLNEKASTRKLLLSLLSTMSVQAATVQARKEKTAVYVNGKE